MVRQLRVGDVPLCSEPSSAWFELESRAPEVCPLRDPPPKGPPIFHGEYTGAFAAVASDGTCSLVLHTRGFSPSAGEAQSLSATFVNVPELED
jgi:hypothetical protein